MAPDSANNSYLLEIDGGTCYTVGDTGLTANQWTWVDYQAGNTANKVSLKLTAGTHNFKLIGREPNVKVDRVMAVLDGSCPTGPTGMGDNCTQDTDTTAPVVAVTTPADGAAITGMVAATATASDTAGVSRVDFYVDNILKATDTITPYTYNWDTKLYANGMHNISAKAYDAAGNVGVDTNTVTTKNGDLTAPSVPGAVTATAATSTSVVLAWTASSDDTGVAGYSIIRNNATIASAVTGTRFTDTTALPATAYSYKVVAYDAAGNSSAPSAAKSVTTPAAPVTDMAPPSRPASLTATTVSSSQINLGWIASTDNVAVTGYQVFRSGIGGTPLKIATVTPASGGSLSFGNTGLTSNTQYEYYVIAVDASGNVSTASEVARATTSRVENGPATPQPTPNARTGVIRGKVTGGRNDKTLVGVKVTAVKDGKRYTATTNAKGIYRFDRLPAGKYRLHWYGASGYETADETLRLRDGKDLVWNMWLVKRGEHRHWWNR